MASNEQVILDLVLEVDKLKKGLTKTETSAKKSGEKAGKKFNKGFSSKTAKGLSSFRNKLLALGTAVGAAFATRQVVRAAQIQENAVNRFNVALTTTGRFTEQASKDFQAYASSIQSATRFGDELILENAALIQSLGNLDQKGLKRATAAAVDLAEALKIDLGTAATLVGKAAAGEVGSFSRYGLAIKKGADNAATFANALTAIEGKFGGTAEKQVKTFSGRMEQLGNTFGDVQEAIGDLIIKSPGLTKAIAFITGKLESAIKSISAFGEGGGNIDGLVLKLIGFARAVNDYVVMPAEIMVRSVSLAFSAMQTGIQTVVTGIANFVNSTFGGIVSGIKKVIDLLPDALQPDGLKEKLDAFQEPIKNFADSSTLVLEDLAADTSEKLQGMFDPNTFAEKSDAFLLKLQETVESAKGINNEAIEATNETAQTQMEHHQSWHLKHHQTLQALHLLLLVKHQRLVDLERIDNLSLVK